MDTNRIRLSIAATNTDKHESDCIYPMFKESTEHLFASATNIIS